MNRRWNYSNPPLTSSTSLTQYLTKLTGKLVEKLIGVMMLDRMSETISFAVVDKDGNDQGMSLVQKNYCIKKIHLNETH